MAGIPDSYMGGGRITCNPQSHIIIALGPGELVEPYKELHPFRCITCGNTFSQHWLEQVDGKWQMIDYSKYNKKKRATRRNACSSTGLTSYFLQKNS